MTRFRSDISQLLDEIARDYSFVCVSYLNEVGKIGSENNGETIRWGARSWDVRKLMQKVKLLKALCLTSSLQDRYYVCRELYAIKPGIHEQFFRAGHDGAVLRYMQEWFSKPTTGMKSKASYFLKSCLTIENLYECNSFFNVDPQYVMPSTPLAAQKCTRAFLESTNYESLMEMTPLNGWFNYAPCAVNEGPCVLRGGISLMDTSPEILLREHSISYKEILK